LCKCRSEDNKYSLHPWQREVICRVTYPTRDNILTYCLTKRSSIRTFAVFTLDAIEQDGVAQIL
jgi:hypothetical protein